MEFFDFHDFHDYLKNNTTIQYFRYSFVEFHGFLYFLNSHMEFNDLHDFHDYRLELYDLHFFIDSLMIF